jgi:hypothetical protein
MDQVRKFRRLPSTDRRLLMQSTLLLGAIRLGLWLLPFKTLRKLLARTTRGTGQVPIDRVAWAMTAASRYVPAATCLSQALATQALLRQRGYEACLRIGVVKNQDGQLQAHAWAESGGVIVIGGPESALERYVPLSAIDGESS